MNDSRQDLQKLIWKTKGARFNASRRLKKRNVVLTFITSFSSIHLLSISIIQLSNLIALNPNQSKWLGFVSIILSIIILVYGLIEGSKEHGINSERYHACGIELGKAYTKLRYSEDDYTSDVLNEYNSILERYSLNHEPIDFDFFKTEHGNVFKSSWINEVVVKLKYKCSAYFLAFILMSVPLSITFSLLK